MITEMAIKVSLEGALFLPNGIEVFLWRQHIIKIHRLQLYKCIRYKYLILEKEGSIMGNRKVRNPITRC